MGDLSDPRGSGWFPLLRACQDGLMSGTLIDIEHLVILMAEGVPAERSALESRATQCRAYHLTPENEDRAALWQEYCADLAAAGFTVAIDAGGERVARDLASGTLGDVTVAEVDAAGLAVVAGALETAPERGRTLVVVALSGGDTLPVVSAEGSLGASGVLLLVSPWTPAGWVSEEVFDHTSILRLCENWTRERGTEVRATLDDWRRDLCGDLLHVIDFREEAEIGPLPRIPGRRLARPIPYFPVADIRLGENGVAVRLGNLGPIAASPTPFLVDDGTTVTSVVVPGSPLDDQMYLRVPVEVVDGTYDVTVRGPNHYHRRFAGSFPDTGVHCSPEYFGRDPWFPSLVLTVWHDLKLPVFFWMEKRLGERAASKAAGYGSGTLERLPGPRQTARFKEEPGANTFGWYDVAVTTSADPTWVREYAGHMPTGTRPSLDY
jgi:hypothetical protein